MLIGELAEKTGLSRDTIRFYEKRGLITVGRKQRRENNYKEYTREHLERLRMIQRIKYFGFTLNETAGLLDMIEVNAASCSGVSGKVREKVTVLDRKIRELQETRKLLMKLSDGENPCCTPLVKDRNCPALVENVY